VNVAAGLVMGAAGPRDGTEWRLLGRGAQSLTLSVPTTPCRLTTSPRRLCVFRFFRVPFAQRLLQSPELALEDHSLKSVSTAVDPVLRFTISQGHQPHDRERPPRYQRVRRANGGHDCLPHFEAVVGHEPNVGGGHVERNRYAPQPGAATNSRSYYRARQGAPDALQPAPDTAFRLSSSRLTASFRAGKRSPQCT
jgi:hypothetical protein